MAVFRAPHITHTCTWFHVQRMAVDLNVQVLGGSGAELLQHAVDGLGDVVRHRLRKLHLAVDDHAALPEVQDLQFLKARQVRLQEWQQLHRKMEISDTFSLFSMRLIEIFCVM